MFVTEILLASGIALLLTALFAAVFGSTGPWSGLWVFFLIILLVAWTAGLWVRPFGPPLWGVYWAPYLLFGLIAALLIAAATPPDRSRDRYDRGPGTARDETRLREHADADEDALAEGAVAAFGVFFWILLLVLLTAVVLGYF